MSRREWREWVPPSDDPKDGLPEWVSMAELSERLTISEGRKRVLAELVHSYGAAGKPGPLWLHRIVEKAREVL
jgi:hypothetical protein